MGLIHVTVALRNMSSQNGSYEADFQWTQGRPTLLRRLRNSERLD